MPKPSSSLIPTFSIQVLFKRIGVGMVYGEDMNGLWGGYGRFGDRARAGRGGIGEVDELFDVGGIS